MPASRTPPLYRLRHGRPPPRPLPPSAQQLELALLEDAAPAVTQAALSAHLAGAEQVVCAHGSAAAELAGAVLLVTMLAHEGRQGHALWAPGPAPQPRPDDARWVALGDAAAPAAALRLPGPGRGGADAAAPDAAACAYALGLPRAPGLTRLAWLGALGPSSGAALAWAQHARGRFTGKLLRQVAAVLDAIGCAPGAVALAAAARRALPRHASPRAFLSAPCADVRQLTDNLAAVQAAQAQALGAAPMLRGRLALVHLEVACHVEQAAARAWSARLPQHIVLVGNAGPTPHAVHWAAATAQPMAAADYLGSAGWPAPGSSGLLAAEAWRGALRRLHL